MELRFIEGKLAQFGSKPGLERITKIMAALGDPQDSQRVIIVSGTNGKGSVTSYVASVLASAGYKAGSYFSPHLVSYNERFKVNGKEISDARLAKYEQEMEALFEKGFGMTSFEALTAIAYRYFADEKADFSVMEAGMGGEFDATAIAKPEVGVITNVELEHTEYLGRTIEDIARTKAGILKKGSKGVSGCAGITLAAIESVAEKNGAVSVSALGRDFFVEAKEVSARRTVFNYLGKAHYAELETLLLGRHQADNAGTAVAAVEALEGEIGEEAVRRGLRSAANPGRLQILSRDPLVVIDAAHNPAGIGSLVSSLPLFDFGRLIVVFGVLAAKDWKEMLRLLGQHADVIIANRQRREGAADPQEVAREASGYAEALVVPDVKESLAAAKKMAGKRDMVLVCGSIYMLGELLSGG